MKAACLFLALAAAHVLMLEGRTIPVSPWTPLAYFWQDGMTALLFAGLDVLVRRERIVWIVYGLLVVYAAVNVPIAWALSSPLTWTMIRAAGGPLRDSITHHVTLPNIAAMMAVAGMGWLSPRVLGSARLGQGRLRLLLVASLVLAGLGPLAAARVDTVGFHRNAFGALWPPRLPDAADTGADWRSSPFARPESGTDSLLRYRGAAAGRNVVLIVLESTPAQYLKPYGATADPTPNLTRLADNAIVFERAYAVYPESVKGLLTVLCSRYLAFQTPAESYEASRCPSLAQRLGNAGYRSALFHSGRFMYLGMDAVLRDRGYQTLEDAGAIGGNVNSSFGVDEPAVIQRILSWIDSGPVTQPFFVTYMPVAGHHPYESSEQGPFSNDSDFDRYRNALHFGDRSIGVLVQGLRARSLEDKTLFVVIGDHGEAFGQHEGNFGHSFFVYDENVRVPYFVAAPGLTQGQTRWGRAASLIDAAPTLLDFLGLPIPAESQGSSLLDGGERMALMFTDYSLGFLGLYDSCWKYILEIESGRSRLFDVCREPGETADRSAADPERTRFYRKTLEGWIRSQSVSAGR